MKFDAAKKLQKYVDNIKTQLKGLEALKSKLNVPVSAKGKKAAKKTGRPAKKAKNS